MLGVNKLVPYGNDAYRSIEDYELSRFACYLVAMNGDPRKSAIASAQAYFAIRTRQAERIETVVRDEIATAKGRMELLGLAKGSSMTGTSKRRLALCSPGASGKLQN